MTIVSNGEVFVVSSGIAVGLIVERGGSVIARTGGITSGAILSGGSEYVSSGSDAISTTVSAGGMFLVSSGGMASATKVRTHGTETVLSGATDSKAVVSGHYATQNVYGTATSSTVERLGQQIVMSGGVAISTKVVSSYQYIDSGGQARDAKIGQQGIQYVSSGGATVGTIVSGTGGEVVFGEAKDTIVKGGYIQVESGGVATHTSLAGASVVLKGGTAYSTTVSAGSTQTVYGVASGTAVYGKENIGSPTSPGGLTEASTVYAGASEYVYSGGTAKDADIDGGYMLVMSNASAVNPTLAGPSGGFLELGPETATISGAVTFATGGDTLQIDSKAMPTAVISGFAATDIITLRAVKYSSMEFFSINGNEVSLITPSGTFVLDIAGASGDTFEAVKATSGTSIETTTAPALASAPTMAIIQGEAPIQPAEALRLPQYSATMFDWAVMIPSEGSPNSHGPMFVVSNQAVGSVPMSHQLNPSGAISIPVIEHA